MGDGEHGGRDLFRPGQEVVLTTDSSIYRGPYRTRVARIEPPTFEVSMPFDEGKLVLLPVGTRVRVGVESGEGRSETAAEIIDRRGGSDRVLVLRPVTARRNTGDARIVAVTSGKGGVGKSMLVVNLAYALTQRGKRVLIIDGDLGTANVDVLLNLVPRHSLADVVRGERHMVEVLVEGPGGIVLLPGGSGFEELTQLDERQFGVMMSQVAELEAYADVILVDTASGVGTGVTQFVRAADESVVITSPEPHAITDAYALIKVLARYGTHWPLHLVVNRVRDERESQAIEAKMRFASRRFLGVELQPLGHIVEDAAIVKAVKAQVPAVQAYPRSRAVRGIEEIAGRILGSAGEASGRKASGMSGLFQRVWGYWGPRENEG